jgi:glycosyltransferase involved in cell wall biosynthesis
MRLLYIADGRSAITQGWMKYFIDQGHEVHLASTFPCENIDGLTSMAVIPVALGGMYQEAGGIEKVSRGVLREVIPVTLRTRIRQMMSPFSFSRAAQALVDIIKQIQPELIHAMRIPFEGMIAAEAIEQLRSKEVQSGKAPLLISVWGNDFTLHANSTRRLARTTQKVLQVCDGLHTDCQRDQRLAKEWGFNDAKPHVILPGGGGVRMELFHPGEEDQEINGRGVEKEAHATTIINPRGFRAYVRNDTFFRAIPLVLEKASNVRFICPGMNNEGQAQRWVSQLGIAGKVELLPTQERMQMAELFRRASISASITTHDGTPNSLLEAMACGCFPIVGDVESLGEWITPEVNGLMVDPGDPKALAEAIIKALTEPELRRKAREMNLALVMERGEYGKCMEQAEAFYRNLIIHQ